MGILSIIARRARFKFSDNNLNFESRLATTQNTQNTKQKMPPQVDHDGDANPPDDCEIDSDEVEDGDPSTRRELIAPNLVDDEQGDGSDIPGHVVQDARARLKVSMEVFFGNLQPLPARERISKPINDHAADVTRQMTALGKAMKYRRLFERAKKPVQKARKRLCTPLRTFASKSDRKIAKEAACQKVTGLVEPIIKAIRTRYKNYRQLADAVRHMLVLSPKHMRGSVLGLSSKMMECVDVGLGMPKTFVPDRDVGYHDMYTVVHAGTYITPLRYILECQMRKKRELELREMAQRELRRAFAPVGDDEADVQHEPDIPVERPPTPPPRRVEPAQQAPSAGALVPPQPPPRRQADENGSDHPGRVVWGGKRSRSGPAASDQGQLRSAAPVIAAMVPVSEAKSEEVAIIQELELVLEPEPEPEPERGTAHVIRRLQQKPTRKTIMHVSELEEGMQIWLPRKLWPDDEIDPDMVDVTHYRGVLHEYLPSKKAWRLAWFPTNVPVQFLRPKLDFIEHAILASRLMKHVVSTITPEMYYDQLREMVRL